MEPKPSEQYSIYPTAEQEADMTAQAITVLLTAMTPAQLLALAERCAYVSRQGFGRVTAEFRNGRPSMLLIEQSRVWR